LPHSITATASTFTAQRSANIHTTTTTHAQQQHKKQQQHAHPQPSSERKFRGKRRSRRQKGREAADAADYTLDDNTHHDRNTGSSAGTEKVAAAYQRKEKETYSASSLSISWTTPSVQPSQHPALQAVLEGVYSQQKSKGSLPQKSRGRSVQQALDHQSDEGEDEGYSQDSDTEKVEVSTFDDEVVSSSTGKDLALSEEAASTNNKEEASEHASANVEVVSSATEKEEAVSEEVVSNKEVVTSVIDTEESSEHAGANVEVVSGIADRRKRDSKPRVEARLRDTPYGYYANGQVLSSVTEKSNASSEVGASDEIVSSSEAADQKSDFTVETNDAAAIESISDIKLENEFESSSPSGGIKRDSPDDDKDAPDSNAPSKSSSNSSKRKAAWFLPSTASSATNNIVSAGAKEEEEEEHNSNLNP
jgi:hypothetical protein